MNDRSARHTRLETTPDVVAFAHKMADEVSDPCSMAIGLKIGLSEMGLVRSVTATLASEGWHVQVHLRLTSPGCQYFFYFRESLEERLLAHPDIHHVEIQWDQRLDWTPEDFSAAARERIDARQRLLREDLP